MRRAELHVSGALSNVRVLDLSRILAGPWATQILADLGAEVIKVERPGVGDDTRAWGPPYQKDESGRDTSESAYFLSANRNKKSVTLDIASPRGQELLRDLAVRSDVLVENFKVGGLRQYGLDYETLRGSAPRLVYCSITGFGQTGPYAQRGGYDFLVQGVGGLMSITGRPDGEAGAGPVKTGVAVTDILTGLYATIAILAALAARERTGAGQHIDIALLDVQVACLANQALNYLTTGRVPGRLGNGHPNVVPYQDFPTADGNMILAIGNDAQFAAFCAAGGQPQLASDERFRSNAARVVNRAALLPLLRQITVQRPTCAWIEMLERCGVPCGPINDLGAVFADAQVLARQLRLDLPHSFGRAPGIASPVRLSSTPVAYRSSPPTLGQHTREVLQELLALADADIAALRAQRCI
jgi:crotonobetainyl-CoA:carnitine CoA-transferase CaiB-like acyl-CoA transferase